MANYVYHRVICDGNTLQRWLLDDAPFGEKWKKQSELNRLQRWLVSQLIKVTLTKASELLTLYTNSFILETPYLRNKVQRRFSHDQGRNLGEAGNRIQTQGVQ